MFDVLFDEADIRSVSEKCFLFPNIETLYRYEPSCVEPPLVSSSAHMANNDVPTSKDAGHKHSHCSGGAIRENPSGATASITRRGRNPGFSERFSASTYENMAAEVSV